MNDLYQNIIICSTDTVWGIGGPVDDLTLKLIYQLKQRPIDKKIMILVGSIEQARSFKQWNTKAEQLAIKLWPGAYSIIVNDQGFRMPNQPLLIKYLLENGPMYMTSANISGQTPVNSIIQAQKIFPQVSKIYDFGPCSDVSSTIYNLDTNQVIVRK
ncbi:Sua5/YciO/YrdC/YwlC family protein [Mycoplasma sp. NEAQ87857]|uniref:L-threonylcarbamoyladenylate synthase n=1 Tax=Mycoplasma sp. NEAQ87857 TaxID=2683967 RepID=UPI00131876F1|nr:Sua5/YciO/YrdC/YwlC family protein [Mycoplasma sp. NEAQ87857]QGZ97626.1 Sua5/YciO/YrdC/YwlC family protein [Mycoplasma sp. NEAQ87857]